MHILLGGDLKGSSDKDDIELINGILDGRTELFRFLVDRYKGPSLSLIHSIVRNDMEAEDILQDVFLKVYKNLNKFNFKSSFATWLYRIVVNSSYTAVRKAIRIATSNLDCESFEIASDLNSFKLLHESERKAIINKILDSLHPQEALILRLHYLAEQSINEIMEITSLSKSNIKVQLHRARKRFNSKMESLLGDDKDHLL